MRYLICILLMPSFSFAQTKITLHSGSTFIGELKVPVWPIQTSWGLLKIPTEEVSKIELGLHYEDGLKDEISRSIKSLNSGVYKERELAQKDVIHRGKYAIPFLRHKTQDLEVTSRFKVIMETILKSNPIADQYNDYDTIHTSQGVIRGSVQIGELEINHSDYGTIKLRSSKISNIVTNKSSKTFTVSISSAYPVWVTSGIYQDWGMRLSVQADGAVDNWPQEAGKFVSGPSGLINVAGRDNFARSGQLMVKIGEAGTPMSIEEFNFTTQRNAGSLMFLIVPNPWGAPSSGSYKVTVKGE